MAVSKKMSELQVSTQITTTNAWLSDRTTLRRVILIVSDLQASFMGGDQAKAMR